MDGKTLYGFYESGGGAKLLTAWEHLTEEDRRRWDHAAELAFEAISNYCDLDDEV